MKLLNNDIASITIRQAISDDDIRSAQALRYQVFYEEFGAAPSPEMMVGKLDIDDCDPFADHLLVVNTDPKTGEETTIGTYRMLRQDVNKPQDQFNSGKWYDLSPLFESGQSFLELSRSCVLPQYRSRPILKLLWQGIADYITEHNIEILFGIASFHTTNTDEIAKPLSYLYHHHLAPTAIRCHAQDDCRIDMNILPRSEINARRSFHDLPPLMKGYLRVGSHIGDGAIIDEQFKTTDVFIIMQTHMLTDRYRKHYERKTEKEIPGGAARKAVDIMAEDL